MWITPSRGYNTVDVDDPAEYLDPALRAQLDDLTDEEKVRLDLRVSELLPLVHVQLDRLVEEDESPFVMQQPPLGIQLHAVEAGDNLLAGLLAQLGAVPLRWRLDMFEIFAAYIAEYGPSFRRWEKLAKRIDRQHRKAERLERRTSRERME